MKGKEFYEQYQQLEERENNFNECLWVLRDLNRKDDNDFKVADEAIKILEEKRSVVLHEMYKLDNMTVSE